MCSAIRNDDRSGHELMDRAPVLISPRFRRRREMHRTMSGNIPRVEQTRLGGKRVRYRVLVRDGDGLAWLDSETAWAERKVLYDDHRAGDAPA
jgi:hypothetical protein